MAKKNIYDKEIDKNIPWDGNSETNNFPVKGSRVEEFLKKTLENKAGEFYYDSANNRYMIFADAENRDAYLNDTSKVELLIGTFDAPFNYTAEIKLITPTYNAVFLGEKGNYINFNFDIKNKQGASTGESVIVNYTFIKNQVQQVFTETYKFGDTVHFNIDEYLSEGTNTIIIGITGKNTLAATTTAITYQVINLSLKDFMNISNVYNLSEGSRTLEVGYTVSGYGTKVVEWYLDGEQLEYNKIEDEVVDIETTRTKYIQLSNLTQGKHSLQFRAYTIVNGDKFYTNTLYRDILIYNGHETDTIIGVAVEIPYKYGILGKNDNISIYGITQYIPYTLRFATYTPKNLLSTEVGVYLDGELQGSVSSKNNVENTFTIMPKKVGTGNIELKCDSSYLLPVEVNKTDMDIQEILSDLVLDFNAIGKSNNSPDKETWEGNGYIATLEGFNWNNTSGWVDNRLEMDAGSKLSINLAPLEGTPTSTGRTVEIELYTKNVTDDNEIICDLRQNGVGILITATKVSLTSSDGVTIETEYKSDENVRIGFVINKSSNVTNQKLSFIYVNGIISRGERWASTDNYHSDKNIVIQATDKAQVSIKDIKVYNTALSSDQMLNNYMLYRDTVAEMMEIYDRNDVYETGTTVFSPDKMMSRLPVMIVTGDIPVLENTSDKDTQITVDIEYYNLQDVTKSFKMKDAAMRPQGTSSMGYPKKNFRIYTTKIDSTILYDYNDNIVENKLYSFTDKAQPVDCWCLKADYAESSGTHNTGIARLWNKALYNAKIEHENILGERVNGYVLRTEAQNKAIEENYPYDVRTTIDGFPILLFYKRNKNDQPIFIGKYNFNNDKSTESVFGFEGIPNFDNSKMQCWEVLTNGNDIALFNSVNNFDEKWSEAFESRYPDTKTPNTSYLKAFCTWMVNVSSEAFKTEKWAHLDVYKMAAYWCYLMRHASADQFVKNAMFTSEDGIKFYYILYDNDTINGLINTGALRIKPTDTRQSVTESGNYIFAGHDSRLWNMLENDEEFMQIVSIVDNALYSSGISYLNTIDIFDNQQADKWVERVYNQDAQYKYIGPYTEKGINNLFMLQGKRDIHRRWWLAKRFSIYDAKFVSGTYKSQAVEIKCADGTVAGKQFTIKAGYPLDYGYGINDVPHSFGITLNAGETHTFTTTQVLNVGDPLRIYAAPNIAELDLSQMTDRLTTVNLSNIYDESLGTKLTKLILGNSTLPNYEQKFTLSGLERAYSLEYLDVQGLTELRLLDLTSLHYLKTLKTFGSSVASIEFPVGAPVERLELAQSMKIVNLGQLPYITPDNLVFEDSSNVSSIVITNCPKLSNDFNFTYNWITTHTGIPFTMDNINWSLVPINKILELGEIIQANTTIVDGKVHSSINLQGVASVTSITLEQVNMLREYFGDNVFDENASFRIKAPDSVFLSGPSSINEGDSAQFLAVVFSDNKGSVKYTISNGSREGVTIDQNTGLLTTVENGKSDSILTIRAIHTSTTNEITFVESTIRILKRTYPTSVSISGNSTLEEFNDYVATVSPSSYTGVTSIRWSLTGDAVDSGFAVIKESSGTLCTIQVLGRADVAKKATLKCEVLKSNGTTVVSKTMTLTVAAYVYPTSVNITGSDVVRDGYVYNLTYSPENYNGAITNISYVLLGDIAEYVSVGEKDNNSCTLRVVKEVTGASAGTLNVLVLLANGQELEASLDIQVLDSTVLMTSTSNPELMQIMYSSGLASNESYMTYDEAASVRNSDLSKIKGVAGSTVFSFDEFEYFTGVTSLPQNVFVGLYITSIIIPDSVTTINKTAFNIPTGITTVIKGGEGVTSIHPESIEGYTRATIFSSKFGMFNFKNTGLVYVGGYKFTVEGVVVDYSMSDRIYTLLYDANIMVKASSGGYFEDMTTSLEILPTKDNSTINLPPIKYTTVEITSNVPEALFKVEGTDTDGNPYTTEVGVGSNILPLYLGYTVTINSATQIQGYKFTEIKFNSGTGTTNIKRQCNFVEEIGIYIQHIQGQLYTEEEWKTNEFTPEDANGVALVSVSNNFVVSKNDLIESNVTLKTSEDIDIHTCSSSIEASTDYNGNLYTEILAAYDGKSNSAAVIAKNYTFPDGSTGYLPAAGELMLVWQNVSTINQLFNLIDGDIITNDYPNEEKYYVSSSVKVRKYSIIWFLLLGNSEGLTEGQTSPTYNMIVRPFSILKAV